MESEDNDDYSPLLALIKYKELAQDIRNHSEMIKDSTVVNFLAYVLDSTDEEVLKTSLDALSMLCESTCGRSAIRSTFGVSEALTSITKTSSNLHLKEKAEKILERLKTPESPVKKIAKPLSQRKKKVLTMHIHGLHLDTQKELEDILMKKMKGIHSVIVDVEHQKCTVTVYEHIDPKNVAMVISENTDMEAQLITRNKLNQEILIPLIESEKTLDLEGLPPYLEEKDSPVKEKAVRSAKDFRITASEWFCTAAGFLQRTIYWESGFKFIVAPISLIFSVTGELCDQDCFVVLVAIDCYQEVTLNEMIKDKYFGVWNAFPKINSTGEKCSALSLSEVNLPLFLPDKGNHV